MAQHIAPIRRQRVCGPVPTTDPTDAALRALADTTDGGPVHRQQQAIHTEAVLDGAGL